VHKTVASLVNAADRFTTQIRTGGSGGSVVSGTSASSTLGGGVLTTGGAGSYNAPGSFQAVAGTSYTLTEVLTAGPSNIGQYDVTVSCSNSRSGANTVLPSGGAQPFNLTPAAGDDLTCTLSNAVRQPTVTLTKQATGSTGTFTFTNTNLVSPVSLSVVTDGIAVSSSALVVNTLGNDVTLMESAPGWTLTAAACTDANSAVTGNAAGFGSLAGNTLTVPGANVVAGADIRCTFTNRKSASFVLQKSWVNATVNDAVTVSTTGGPSTAASIARPIRRRKPIPPQRLRCLPVKRCLFRKASRLAAPQTTTAAITDCP